MGKRPERLKRKVREEDVKLIKSTKTVSMNSNHYNGYS
jgi:hypothetical protein